MKYHLHLESHALRHPCRPTNIYMLTFRAAPKEARDTNYNYNSMQSNARVILAFQSLGHWGMTSGDTMNTISQ